MDTVAGLLPAVRGPVDADFGQALVGTQGGQCGLIDLVIQV